MKKIISMLLALMLILSLTTTAFASNEKPHTITINNPTDGYEYVAYQIFKGDLVGDQLQNIEWGENVNTTKTVADKTLMQALNEIEAFKDCKDEVDVATVLAKIEKENVDHETTKAFADIVSGYLTATNAGTSRYVEKKGDVEAHYKIDVNGDGYYLVKNTEVPAANGDTATGSYTRYILRVVGDVTVGHKGDIPKVEKKILVEKETEGNKVVEEKDASTADIGDTIKYQFTGTMPSNIADYDSYYYVFTDTMSEGLTYTGNLQITVNGKDVTKYFYANNTKVEATETTEGYTTLKVGIQDILALENLTNPAVGSITDKTEVVVTYTALVNEKANIGVDGEKNEVKLTFSNDPNNDGDGTTTPPEEPEEPNPKPNIPTGETPKDVVKTYTTEIKITKVDGLNNNKTLTGAKFSIEGVSSKVVVVNKEMFVEDANASYYRLKDGTYTTVTPTVDNPETVATNEDNTASYESTTVKYKKVEVVTTDTVKETFEAEGWVDENGVITFTGLGEGSYTITELVAPNGYNSLTEDITVIITSNVNELTKPTLNAETKVEWVAKDGDTAEAKNWTVTTDGKIELTVENTSGATLPETGGMGTTLLYVVGGIMVLAAIVLLITKKRMHAAE